jgi:hypothetical protein
MKSIKLALLAGAAIAVTAAGAQADDLEALKAQIETLNARVAAMEAAPAVPAGYQLLAVSESEQIKVPGLEMSAQDKALYGNKATSISVLPTADAPAGTTISWSGFVRTGLVLADSDMTVDLDTRANDNADWEHSEDADSESDDLDVFSRGEISVTGVTDTAVGEVGVKVTLRGNFDVIDTAANVTMQTAWGYWAMTPELTFGGGFTGSLGNIGYGMDGACNCYFYNTVAFNPGDTSQMRLSYASGPFSAAIALEDATVNDDGVLEEASEDQLGASGEIKYSGDTVSGEVSASWRGLNDDDDVLDEVDQDFIGDSWWQVGAGIGFGLGDVASVSLAAAMGEGPTVAYKDNAGGDDDDFTNPWRNSWWGVSGIITGHLSDGIHAEIGAGYKAREFDDVETGDGPVSADAETMVIGGGIYYTPVDQLTIGVESSYTDNHFDAEYADDSSTDPDARVSVEDVDTTLAFVTVWRF